MRRTGGPAGPVIVLACLAMIAAWPAAVSSHEIPSDVTVRIVVKPTGDRLELLVRAPLESMQDITFPTTGPGYLDVGRADRTLRDAAMRWLSNDIELFENGSRLSPPELIAVRASIPSDRSFTEHALAREHVLGPPLPASIELPWQQALLDALFELPIESEDSAFAILPGLERLGLAVTTVIRFEAPGGVTRMYQVEGAPEIVELDPRWHQAAFRFVVQGFEHILDGADHLLFLFCLVLPFRRSLRSLVVIVTAFTVAHSLTLIGSAYGLAPDVLWFTPLIETLIAASIFYMAIENIVAPNVRMRWAVAFGFGLVHGFGFSFALRDTLQFAGDHVLTSLLSFNVGVELGQLFVLLLLVPLLNLVFRYVRREQLITVVISVVIAHTAWHWMGDRYAVLRQYPIDPSNLFSAVEPVSSDRPQGGEPWLS
ncbi:MAG TPA: HupE/UreJ family protein [Gammaproteobacteria bacterium]|nr:HupE/UreJ family protein [Gammaproteobacteria bacterium]